MSDALVIAVIAIGGFNVGAAVGVMLTVWIHQRSFERDPDQWIDTLNEIKRLKRIEMEIREAPR